MTLKKGAIRYNPDRGIFWQKTYFEDEKNQIFLTALVCVSEEFFSDELRKRLEDVMNKNTSDVDIQNWFNGRINTIAVMEKDSQNEKIGNIIIDLHPQTNGMLDATKSILQL